MKQRAPGHGPWREISYGQALARAESVAQWLIDQGLGAGDSVMVLSANSLEHAQITLGCYTAGVPVAPISGTPSARRPRISPSTAAPLPVCSM